MAEELRTLFTEKTTNIVVIGRVTTDKMKLFISVEHAEGSAVPARDEIVKMIERHVPTGELNMAVIDDIVRCLSEGQQKVEERRIAVGRPPETGADGKLLLLKKKYTGQGEVLTDAKGRADLTHLHLFDNIHKGDIVARLYPPKPGLEGKNVLGAVVPARPGKPFRLLMDKSLRLSDDPGGKYQVIKAEQDGYLAEESGRLSVRKELEVEGDLDYRYGALDFIGSVKIEGDVLPGFHVKAQEGIEVSGSVRGGSLISPQGDIVVKGYVYGGAGSCVITGKSFTASVMQEVNAEIKGDIVVLKESRDSLLRSHAAVRVPKGAIIGGTVSAVQGVESAVLGADSGIQTKVILCTDVEATSAFEENEARIKNHDNAIHLLRLHLGPYADNPQRMRLLVPAFRAKMTAFYNKLQEVEKSKIRLLAERNRMLEAAERNKEGRVNVLQKAHEGLEITIGDKKLCLKESLAGPVSLEFCEEQDEILPGTLKPLGEAADKGAGKKA